MPDERPVSERQCKDCRKDYEELKSSATGIVGMGEPKEPKWRAAPHPGPRCVTHHRAVTKARKDARHASYVAKTYALDDGEYDHLKDFQLGVCAICRRANGKTRKLSVDHDHRCCNSPVSCGKCVRGLLCRPCNDMLGHARDDVMFFARAINYLRTPPARVALRKDRPE